jgi:D-aminopeptidase
MKRRQQARARDAGIVIGVLPAGPSNCLTDVPGVRVGHCTVSHQDETVARTGVTAIWPAAGDLTRNPVLAGSFVLNGFGEITGRAAIDEWGTLSGPVLLTATMSVGIVYHATLQYLCDRDPELGRLELVIPVVGECDDSFLNDSRGFHVTPEHVFMALDEARDGPVAEGCVGAGTGMQCFEFKGGIGSASRVVKGQGVAHTVGVLVETNLGTRELLTIDGVPVGRSLTDLMPQGRLPDYWGDQVNGGSCIVIVGTDAPLTNHQVAKLAKRSSLGLARVGSVGANSSGELMLAFTSGNRLDVGAFEPRPIRTMNDRAIDVLYQAAIEATEEAVVNALFAAVTTAGRDGNTLHALPVDRTLEILNRFGKTGGPAHSLEH